MQWVIDGPDIPERLLQAHEDGRVVFFCGAGISKPAGLPHFKKLLSKLYKRLHQSKSDAEREAIGGGSLDTALGLLEARIAGGRQRVRSEIAKLLEPDFAKADATDTHEALLVLSKNKDDKTRLVTTNFDQLFEHVIRNRELEFDCSSAPSLPVPKDRWTGLVYLHGLLPEDGSPYGLEQLVMSSGDFGRAYLTEGWAARFVTELFRSFTICFVGYSLGDPVLRYMMDALAADRAMGARENEVFALAGFARNEEGQVEDYWSARDVTPLLYLRDKQHSKLHETLRKWAETYRVGVAGKERIIVEYAHLRPHESTKQDDFVSRLLWALSDRSGLPAKKFAELDPVPSLEWLEPLFEKRFLHSDLERFGVAPNNEFDEDLSFSVLRRPSPYAHSPWMDLIPFRRYEGTLDNVMWHLANWLLRHLDDPHLVRWMVEHGGTVSGRFSWLIQRRLTELGELERDQKTEELDRIRASAPSAIPRPRMRSIWRLIVSGRIKERNGNSLRNWWERCQCDGLTGFLRMELRDYLSPVVSFSRSLPWPESGQSPTTGNGTVEVDHVLRWEVELAADYVHDWLAEVKNKQAWQTILPELLPVFASLLRDALELIRDLGGADEKRDHSDWYQPSIEEHDQNHTTNDWTALIELTRDAWLRIAEADPQKARLIAADWYNHPYPVFKRLCFFAATKEGVISQQQAIDWLLADKAWWLWSTCTRREAIRLIVSLAPRLDPQRRDAVEREILEGPPREMYREDLEESKFEYFTDKDVWIRLSKLEAAGPGLGDLARVRLHDIRSRHPEWQMQDGDRDEFLTWTSTWSSDDEFPPPVRLPRELNQLVAWLKKDP